MAIYQRDEIIAFVSKKGEVVCHDCVPEDVDGFCFLLEEEIDEDTIIVCDKCKKVIHQ